MLESEHYDLFDKLRHSETSEDRRTALRELTILEQKGSFEENDFLELLKEDDSVLQIYAIGAIGRNKIKSATAELIALFETSQNPLILSECLSSFSDFASADFQQTVINKIKSLESDADQPETDAQFLLDQILVPALKYLQLSGDTDGIAENISGYLDHDDSTVRWHTLRVFNLLAIPLPENRLKAISEGDKSTLVREQAAVMLERMKKQTT